MDFSWFSDFLDYSAFIQRPKCHFSHSLRKVCWFDFFARTFVKRREVHLPLTKSLLTLPAPCISESYFKIKTNLNFYFRTSLWCVKWWQVWDTTKKCENKNLIFSLRPSGIGTGRVRLISLQKQIVVVRNKWHWGSYKFSNFPWQTTSVQKKKKKHKFVVR